MSENSDINAASTAIDEVTGLLHNMSVGLPRLKRERPCHMDQYFGVNNYDWRRLLELTCICSGCSPAGGVSDPISGKWTRGRIRARSIPRRIIRAKRPPMRIASITSHLELAVAFAKVRKGVYQLNEFSQMIACWYSYRDMIPSPAAFDVISHLFVVARSLMNDDGEDSWKNANQFYINAFFMMQCLVSSHKEFSLLSLLLWNRCSLIP